MGEVRVLVYPKPSEGRRRHCRRQLGLLGLRDRAAAMNGELRLESPPGHGTALAVLLLIPVSRAAYASRDWPGSLCA
jgi:glucose-6-phosphate-specific signal transduction histidine kinase